MIISVDTFTCEVIMAILAIHFLADFVAQNGWIAANKSKKWGVLLLHTAGHGIAFSVFGWKFGLTTFVIHTATDFVTSRMSSRFSAKGQHRAFWLTIGGDQMIHGLTLIATLVYFFGR